MTPGADFAYGRPARVPPDVRANRWRRARRSLWATLLALGGVGALVVMTGDPLDEYVWPMLLAPAAVCGAATAVAPTRLGRVFAFCCAALLTPFVLLLVPYGFVVELPAVAMLWYATVAE